MKKLTAGIFSVLVGLVSVNAADAAVASQGYVDAKVGVNTTKITELEETVATNVTTAAEATAAVAQDLADYEIANDKVVSDMDAAYKLADQNLQTQIDGKQVALKVAADSALKLDAEGNLSLEGIATSEGLTNLTNTVAGHTTTLNKLEGTEQTEGSVAYQIAAAITAEETRANNLYATQTDLTTLQGVVNDETNGLAATKAIADQNKTDIGTINTTIATLATKEALDANANADSALAGRVTTAESNITTLQNTVNALDTTYATNDELTAAVNGLKTNEIKANADAISALQGSVGALGDTYATDAELTSVVDGLKSTEIKAAVEAAAAAQTTADGAVSVNNAQQTAIEANAANFGNYTKTADLGMMALANVPETCSSPANYCVLTYNNAGFYWEVIAREDGETLPDGTTYTPAP